MFATQDGVVELWVIKTDTYTSTKTGEICVPVQSIVPIPEGARGNAKSFEVSEYDIESALLDAIVFEGQSVLCKFANVIRPTQDRFGQIINTRILVDLLAVGDEPMAPTTQTLTRPQAQAQTPRPAQQSQG